MKEGARPGPRRRSARLRPAVRSATSRWVETDGPPTKGGPSAFTGPQPRLCCPGSTIADMRRPSRMTCGIAALTGNDLRQEGGLAPRTSTGENDGPDTSTERGERPGGAAVAETVE